MVGALLRATTRGVAASLISDYKSGVSGHEHGGEPARFLIRVVLGAAHGQLVFLDCIKEGTTSTGSQGIKFSLFLQCPSLGLSFGVGDFGITW